jgi:catechol 2,3-dioxygenase-like lactoylglutathione lyase family enzyme
MADTTTKTHITDVRTVGIPVSAQDQAVQFYVETLGFEKRMDVPMGENERWIEVAPPGGAASIALVRRPADGPIGVDTGVRLTSRDVVADHAALQAAGVDVDAEVIPFPVPMFSFRDPDGNRLVIVGTGA